MIRSMTVARYIVILLAGSALSAQPTGPIRLAGPSPRIETLRREAKTGSAAVEAFWAQLAREHTPIVEPFPDDQNQALLTLVWRGDSQTKSVQVAGRQMEHIPSTDVWYVTFAVASHHRLAYLFRIDDKPGKQPDPLNPNRFTAPVLQERPASAINTESVYMNSSIALVPKGTRSPWVDPQPAVAAGSIKESNYPSKIFGGARRVWIYHPPVDAGSLAGLLICLWGKDYLNEIPVPTILDNLLNQRRIFPLTAVFIDNDGDRFQSFQRTKQIADSLATELIPWIRSQDKLPADPRRTIIAGYSAAGLASAYAAFAIQN